jgi:hypothetical protein
MWHNQSPNVRTLVKGSPDLPEECEPVPRMRLPVRNELSELDVFQQINEQTVEANRPARGQIVLSDAFLEAAHGPVLFESSRSTNGLVALRREDLRPLDD